MDLDLIYLAGFFDGEGCISISKGKPLGNSVSTEYRCKVTIANTKKESLTPFVKRFGGFISGKKSKNKNAKLCHQYNLSSREACDFCKIMLPFLKLKKENAKLLIEFYDNQTKRKKPVSKKELERRNLIYIQMKKLNRKGIK